MARELLVVAAVVFGVNLLPAFGPPTWIVLAYFRLRHDVPIVPLVIVGAFAASCGRYILALGSRRLGGHLPEKRRNDLEALGGRISGHGAAQVGGLGLFLLSPLPSAQLFEAAGLTPGVRLVPLTAAFFVGRLASYTIYVSGASLAESTVSRLLNKGIGSPASIALQVVTLGLLAGVVFTPWAKIFAKRSGGDGGDVRAADRG